ncbi:MAG: Glucose-phosphate thymidylyltransferase [Streptosporangiaceae bacterium]|nr:Glucose-phosphate thymidylyltransferase [Streptosporangiaceae bacterium]
MCTLHPKHYFDVSPPSIDRIFAGVDIVWDVLPRIQPLVEGLLQNRRIIRGTVMPGAYIGDGPVFVGDGAIVEPGAYILGPAYIGSSAVVRHGAYVRTNVIMMEGSVLGHATEAKNCLLLPEAKAPHFAYVGDSVLGHRVNLGAGTKLSNAVLRTQDRSEFEKRDTIRIKIDDEIIDTGLRKFGAIIGDDAQIGCNVVLNPGTILGPRVAVYPNATLSKGAYPADTIIKMRQDQIMVERAKKH